MNGMSLPESLLPSKGCGIWLNALAGATYGISMIIRWISILKITTLLEEVNLPKSRRHQKPGHFNFKAQMGYAEDREVDFGSCLKPGGPTGGSRGPFNFKAQRCSSSGRLRGEADVRRIALFLTLFASHHPHHAGGQTNCMAKPFSTSEKK